MSDRSEIYFASIDVSSGIPAVCGCGWSGSSGDLKDIKDCALDPGDPSPAGRCPECDSLAYLDRPKDRIQDAAKTMFETLEDVAEWLETGKVDGVGFDKPQVLAAVKAALTEAGKEG